MNIDTLDRRILERLAADARLPWSELARELGVSQPTVAERVRRMEERGVILGTRLELDYAKLGHPIGAFVRIVLDRRAQRRVEELAAAIPQILEMHRVTGEDCLIARVAARSVEELAEVINRLADWGASNTSLILGTPIRSRHPLGPGLAQDDAASG